MIRISISQTAIAERKGTSSTSGKPYHLRIQTGYAHTLDADGNSPLYPEKFQILLRDDQPPFVPGEYQLAPSAVYVNRNGDLDITPRLIPLKKPATAQA
jgi:hypothetical protein